MVSFFGLLSVLIFSTAAAEAASTETFEDLERATLRSASADGSALTLSEWVTRLPRGLRSNVIYLYHSESPQKASFGSPRVVVFSDNAKLILAWNGGALPGSVDSDADHTVDALAYNERTQRYEPRAIHFAGKFRTASGWVEREAVRVDRAPKTCTQCHSVFHGVQPTLATYRGPVTPGVYGNAAAGALGSLEQRAWRDTMDDRHYNLRYRGLARLNHDQDRAAIVRRFSRLLSARDRDRRAHFAATDGASRVTDQWRREALLRTLRPNLSMQAQILRARWERAAALLGDPTVGQSFTGSSEPTLVDVWTQSLAFMRADWAQRRDLWRLAWNARTRMEADEFDRRFSLALDFEP